MADREAQQLSAARKRVKDLENILASIPAPMFVTDADLKIISVNDAALRAVGYRREEVEGRMSCADFARTPLCGTAQCPIRNCMRTGEPMDGETVMETHDGRKVPIRAVGSALFDDDGRPYGGMEVIMDQTEQKNALGAVGELVEAAKKGELDKRADADQAKGDFKKLFMGINEMLDALIDPLHVTADYVERISKGDIPEPITTDYQGEFGRIKDNLNQCVAVMKNLLSETDTLINAASAGQLDTRADAGQFSGGWKQLVNGINRILDGVITPMRDIGDTLDRLSAGDSKAQVTADYQGDYAVLKTAANNLGNQIGMVVEEMEKLAAAAAEGNLDYRGDPSRVNGDIAEIINGANRTLDRVVQPINEAAEVLARIAERDLTTQVEGDYKGDFARIKEALNATSENLNEALAQVAQATDQVSSASGQISSGSQSLAEAASEQASSLEEISSSLEEISSMTKQNADNANQAKNLSQIARGSADKGTEAIQRMTEAIDKIKTSSDETAKIVKTIDEIAFQTNLLALNAAVEAARAGEAGKGFAVVAEEVRNLAQRSAEAAKTTADMIEDSVKNAEGGVKVTEEVAGILGEIAEGARKMNELVEEIAAASGEQSQGIDQINTAVSQLDQVTQQNAANAEESASAAEELNSQAEELLSLVNTFQLAEGQRDLLRQRRSRKHGPARAQAARRTRGAQEQVQKKRTVGVAAKAGKVMVHTGNGKNPEEAIPLDDDEDFEDF